MMSLATLAISCSQKEEDKLFNERPAYDVFYAKMENADTKVFADDLLRVLWDADDRVSIFNKYTYNQEYRFNGETGDNAGAFKIVESEDFVTGNALDKVYSVYPYIESTKIDNDGLITIDMPAEQKYREDSFGIGANTMIAISENNQLMFKNLCGYMIVKLYGDDVTVKSLTIKGNKGESISGKANVTAEIDKVPEIIFAETATKSITLTCDTPIKIGSTPETATPFWIVVPPVVFSEGFTLTVTAADGGVYSKSTSNKFEIMRNGISRMTALETLPIQFVAIDLGLSVKWASFNLGASKPEEYGDFYAWGEIEPKTSSTCDWSTYKWCNGTESSLTKYCPSDKTNSWGGPGSPDNKTTLDLEDDVAHVVLGGTWRMPTDNDWTELREKCTWKWTSNYNETGIAGMVVTSDLAGYTDKSIFLPAAGMRAKNALNLRGTYGYYWSNSIANESPLYAYGLCFCSSYYTRGGNYRRSGQSIRAVKE